MLPYPNCKIAIPSYKFVKNASQLGFTHLDITPWDLLPSFLPDALTRFLANKVYFLQHAPYVKNLCGTVSIWGRKPGDDARRRPQVNLATHAELFKSVSVVLPCHNESMNLPPFITRLKELYNDYLHEIIIVNDNSTDSTAEVADEMANSDSRVKVIHRKPPNGVGRALKDGYDLASGRYILSMDCDFILILSELRDLFDAIIEGYDGAIGSRFSHNSIILNYPFMKIIGNRAVHFLIKLAFPNIRDISNNLKLYKSEVFKTISIEEPHFAANLETGLKPLLAGYKIKEVPISWIDRSINMGSSSFRVFRVGPAYFSALWKMITKKRGTSRRLLCNCLPTA
jgi:glycosyltransferase involved in cell wall biosynthesis